MQEHVSIFHDFLIFMKYYFVFLNLFYQFPFLYIFSIHVHLCVLLVTTSRQDIQAHIMSSAIFYCAYTPNITYLGKFLKKLAKITKIGQM